MCGYGVAWRNERDRELYLRCKKGVNLDFSGQIKFAMKEEIKYWLKDGKVKAQFCDQFAENVENILKKGIIISTHSVEYPKEFSAFDHIEFRFDGEIRDPVAIHDHLITREEVYNFITKYSSNEIGIFSIQLFTS